MTCKRPYCDQTVLPWLDPDYCSVGCRDTDTKMRQQRIRGLEAEPLRADPASPAEDATAKVLDTGETLQHHNGQWTAADPAGSAEHLAVTETDRIMTKAAARLGYQLAELHWTEPTETKPARRPRFRWPWSRP